MVEKKSTWSEFLERCRKISDENIIHEIECLEHLIDCDVAKDSLLFDAVLDLHDFLRDECVKRVSERLQD